MFENTLIQSDQHWAVWAILCGTLGYAVATFIGVAIGFWLQ